MFKKLALLLISLIAMPAAINCGASSFNNATMVVADEGDPEDPTDPTDPEEPVDLGPSPYSYTEDPYSAYERILRYYEPCLLIPTVEKKFCAPSGYTFVLSYSDEQVDELMKEMDRCKAKYNQWMMDCIFFYGLEGTMVYSDSDPEWPNGRDEARDYILSCINGRELYEIKELTVPTNLSFRFEFEFCAEDINYTFILENDSIAVEPYDEYDFISVGASYYIRDGEHRFNLRVHLIDGFFFEEPSNNENGFHTDSYHDEWGEQKADCEVTFFAHGTVPIGTTTRLGSYGLEMYYSDVDLDIRARLTFVSGGKSYEYWSHPLMVGNPKLHLVVDGYYDRDFVQRGQDHLFEVDYNHNVFGDLMGSITVHAYPESLCDQDYGHIYRTREEFPSVGQAGHYYYILTDEEAQTYNPNDKSFNTGYGEFFVWNEENQEYQSYWGFDVVNAYNYPDYYYGYGDFEGSEGEEYDGYDEEYSSSSFSNMASLPFDGVWSFYFSAGFGGRGYSVNLSESSNQFITVVSPNKTETTLALNVPDNVNLLVDGEQVEIIPTLSSSDDSLVYYYEYELSKEGVVEVIKDEENDKFIVNPLAAGSVELTISAESRLFDKITKTVTITVVDAIYNVAKIDAPVGFATAGEDLRCSLNIKGLRNFQNIDIDWDVSKSNGEVVPDSKIIDNKDASITIVNADIGDYTISASYEGVELDTITRRVRYQANSGSSSEDAEVVLNVPDSINLLSGGDPLEIIASVSPLNEGVDYYYDFAFSKENVVTYTTEENGKITLQPINSGTVTLNITINYEPNHVLTKTVNIRVLDAIYDVSSIKVPDEFHYAGKDLTAAVTIRGFQSFQNLDIDWVVTNKKGEELTEDQYVDNGDASITLKEPGSDDYTISASYEGILLDTIVVKVRHVDMNKFLRANIWWIFLLTMGMVALIFFLRSLMHRGKTTVENIAKVYDVLCACLSDDKLTKEELIRIKKELSKCLHRCEDLNIEALNQYEKAIRYLRKSLFDVKTLLNNWDTISPEDKGAYTDHLDKDLNKALSVAKEIETAKQLSEEYHAKANKQNYESISEDKHKK